MFTVNAICVGTILTVIPGFDVKQVAEFYFRKYISRIPDNRSEIEEEIMFGRRNEIIHQMIRIFNIAGFLVSFE